MLRSTCCDISIKRGNEECNFNQSTALKASCEFDYTCNTKNIRKRGNNWTTDGTTFDYGPLLGILYYNFVEKTKSILLTNEYRTLVGTGTSVKTSGGSALRNWLYGFKPPLLVKKCGHASDLHAIKQ